MVVSETATRDEAPNGLKSRSAPVVSKLAGIAQYLLPSLRHSPILYLVVSLMAGSACQRFLLHLLELPDGWLAAISACSLIAWAAGIYCNARYAKDMRTLCLIFLALGALSTRAASPSLPLPPGAAMLFERPETLHVARIDSAPDYQQARIRIPVQLRYAILDGRAEQVKAGVLLSIQGDKAAGSWHPGDTLLFRTTLRRFHNFNNPGGYDYVRLQAEKGLIARASIPDGHLLVKLSPSVNSNLGDVWVRVWAAVDGYRQRALSWVLGEIPGETAFFYAALLLGYQNLVGPEWQEHLARTGTTHLLSISGLHLGMVSLAVLWVARLVMRRFFVAALRHSADVFYALWPALAAAGLYALLSGFSAAPVWRSLVMLSAGLLGAFWFRVTDPISLLSLAAMTILIADPNCLFQISFQLSFACMLAVFVLYPRFDRFHLSRQIPLLSREGLPGRIFYTFEEAFSISVAVNLFVLPLSIYYFKGISFAGLLANIILIPLVGFAVLPLGLAALAVYAISPVAGAPILFMGSWFLSLSLGIIRYLSDPAWAYFWIGTLSVSSVVLFYAGMCMLLGPASARVKLICAALLLAGFLGAQSLSKLHAGNDERLQVTFIDVGQGSSTLVQFPGKHAMLVDGGGFFDDSLDIGRAVVAPVLWELGVKTLDNVVLSHDHPDHSGGLRFVLSHFDVGRYWAARVAGDPARQNSLAQIASARGIPAPPPENTRFKLGGCTVTFLHPTDEFLKGPWDRDLNNASVVVMIEYGQTVLLLPGDIDLNVIRSLFSHVPQERVLVASPHHGSERSNGRGLSDCVGPEAIVFSCGADNRFGFPARNVLADYGKAGIKVFRTDQQGAVTAVSDGRGWDISTFLR